MRRGLGALSSLSDRPQRRDGSLGLIPPARRRSRCEEASTVLVALAQEKMEPHHVGCYGSAALPAAFGIFGAAPCREGMAQALPSAQSALSERQTVSGSRRARANPRSLPTPLPKPAARLPAKRPGRKGWPVPVAAR